VSHLEPNGTYRPQYRLRWRDLVRVLDRTPRLKVLLADLVRGLLQRVFDPGLVTTERVIEYPFVFQRLNGIAGPILDIGCCSSGVPIALASRGFRVVGLDFNPYPHSHPNLRAVRGDAMRCPFAAGTFAAVLAISVIEHIGIGHYGDPLAPAGDEVTIQEIARILRPGGLALITVPFGQSMTNELQRVYDPPGLTELLKPLTLVHVEHAWSRAGLWMPCSEGEAASVDWNGPARALALIVGRAPERGWNGRSGG
jgi:SAM-dependent methyltransferase